MLHATRTIVVLLAVIGLRAPQGLNAQAPASPKTISWYMEHAPFPMPPVALPQFPAREFRLTDYGATGDGQSLTTMAFRQAIKACAAAGGGRVVVPAGTWLTGPIELLGHVDLHLESDALIQFTRDHTQYPPSGEKAASLTPPISANGQEDIAITGEGILDGAGDSWRPVKREKMTGTQWRDLLASGGVLSADGKIWWPDREEMNNDHLRPFMVSLADCRRILIQGVTLRNSPKFVFCPSHCSDLTLDHAHIFNEWWAQNGDGMDISACKRVIIYACTVNAGDDGICMKSSGTDPNGPALQDIIVAGCTVYRAHGGFVIGSNTDGGMHDIFVSDCVFAGTDVGLRFKSNMGRGGLVDSIFIQDIVMEKIVREAVLFDTYYQDVPAGATRRTETPTDKTPVFRDFYIRRIDCQGAATAISITGLPQMPITNISFDSVTIRATRGLIATQARNINLHEVKLDVAEKPVYQTDPTAEIRMN
jgi:polygalacturonase